MADTVPPRLMDLRGVSTDWTFTCALHGNVKFALVFNGDLSRALCATCVETQLGLSCNKLTVTQGSGPAVNLTAIVA
jgi:hypothetical protein